MTSRVRGQGSGSSQVRTSSIINQPLLQIGPDLSAEKFVCNPNTQEPPKWDEQSEKLVEAKSGPGQDGVESGQDRVRIESGWSRARTSHVSQYCTSPPAAIFFRTSPPCLEKVVGNKTSEVERATRELVEAKLGLGQDGVRSGSVSASG